VANAAVVSGEKGRCGGSDNGGFAIGIGEGVDGFERLPDREDDDFEFRAGEIANEELGAYEAGDGFESGKNTAFEMLAVGREILRREARGPIAGDHDAAGCAARG